MAADQQFGLTPALSVELPSEAQKRDSEALLEELRRQGTFETTAETQRRYKVLESLRIIADAFVQRVAKEMFPDTAAMHKDARAKVFTYGSFRLGVFGPGSDIDTLVVAPKYVTRMEYFKYFPDMLVAMAPPGAITDLTAVQDAFVPIIKFEYSGISIDLIFSRIMMTSLPADPNWSLEDKNLLRGLDEAELRSLNGTRVTDEIVQLVPEQRTFRDALRAVKLWGQRKAIYGNIMGFPGGVAWAMLVARVCQLYPKATSSMVVSKFFGIIYRWPWPNPVLLKLIEDGPLQARIWNPKIYKGDSFHLMPIITPAYPSMCATFNITKSSLTIIQRELRRASDLSQMIVLGRKPWKDLFSKHTFFTADFKYYISIVSASTNKEAHKMWSGFVESKVRMLVQGLERHQSIALARPYVKGYERSHLCKSEVEIEQVQNGELSYVQKTEEVDEKVKIEGGGMEVTLESSSPAKIKGEDVDGNVKTEDLESKPQGTEVYTLTHYIGVELAEGAKSLDLSYQVNEFKELCFAWEKYKKELSDVSSLSIQHVRNFALPDDIFDAGEVKPMKPVKKKRPAAEESGPVPKRQQAKTVATAAAAAAG